MEFQTRSELNGTEYFSSLKEAYEHAKKDSSVWKISYGSCPNHHRWVKETSKPSGKLVWIDQPIRIEDGKVNLDYLRALTDEDFKNMVYS